MWVGWVILGVLFVAYANGANDNFKGVATLFGSGTTTYRKALAWATLTTLAGSFTSFFLATKLVKTFSGKGLVPDGIVHQPAFLIAVILGAAFTVFIAARIGIPISTTHALTGALVGSGLVTVGSTLGFQTLGSNFFIPLLMSPLVSMTLAMGFYPLLRGARRLTGLTKENCVCVGGRWVPARAELGRGGTVVATSAIPVVDVVVGDTETCAQASRVMYTGQFFGITAQKVLDLFHFLSAGAVSFARGLNDTPKIVTLLVATGTTGLQGGILCIAVVMALGGILGARPVAETVSKKITEMDRGQGFAANMVTTCLVILASRWGMPVSTTHVSCGSLFGIGVVNKKADWGIIRNILSAWILTLPAAALCSGFLYWMLGRLFA